MMYTERINAVLAAHPDIDIRYLADESQLEEHGQVIMLCEHGWGADLDSFFASVDSFCDKLIVWDRTSDPVDEEYFRFGKLIAYIQIRNGEKECAGKRIMFDIASLLNVEWSFFIQSNERFVPQFIETTQEHLRDDRTRAVAYDYILTGSEDTYYLPPNSALGAYREIRMFRMKDLQWENTGRIPAMQVHSSSMLLERRITREDYDRYGIDLFTEVWDTKGIYRNCNQQIDNYIRIPDAELRNSVHSTLIFLCEYFLHSEPGESGQIGLYTGDCGTALLLAQMYLWNKDDRYLQKVEQYLEAIETRIATGRILASFCSGLAGFGWLATYLQQKALLQVSPEYWFRLDEILERQMI